MTNCTLEFVSIHALLAECDPSARFHAVNRAVSIHALLAECDKSARAGWTSQGSFNPRTPCGVRPASTGSILIAHAFQSTHSLRSATFFVHRYYLTPAVSIHALLAECDAAINSSLTLVSWFQSTHSLRSATYNCVIQPPEPVVSIHALLAECDLTGYVKELSKQGFNPRTPCGVRPVKHSLFRGDQMVSIHALLAECD